MVRRIMIAALASAALSLPGAALAGPGKAKVAKAERAAGKAAAKAERKAAKSVAKADKAALKAASKAARADRLSAANATARANAASLIRSGTVVDGPLAGLSVGSEVMFGPSVAGTVERIVPNRDGRVRNVLVRLNDGRIVPLAPASLQAGGGGWEATTLRPNANRR